MSTDQEFGLQLAQIEAMAASHYQGDERDQLITFIRCYYSAVSDDVLSEMAPSDLYAIAAGHYQSGRQRAPGQANAQVFRPSQQQHGWQDDVVVLQTCVRDCPFLVDTIALAVRKAGGQIRWLIHPVLDVQRDSQGVMQAVANAGEDDAKLESFVHLHIHGLSDEQDLQQFQQRIVTVLDDLRTVVDDYFPMREKLAELLDDLATVPTGVDAEDISEVAELLRWLDWDHFTFLGYTESRLVGSAEQSHFETLDASALGLLRRNLKGQELVAPASEMDKYASSRRPVVVTKANVRSHIHHHEFLDSVSVKQFDDAGQATGTHRFIGLFSNEVYNSLPNTIPVIRRKLDWVMTESSARPGSHAHKQLNEILNSLPTDELFQSSESELLELGLGVRAMRETQRLRLFLRQDRYRRFYSCLVYLQRDLYSSRVRERMGTLLQDLLAGEDLEHHVAIQRNGLARLHYIVRIGPGSGTQLTVAELESRLQEASRSWDDGLREYLEKTLPRADARRMADHFQGGFSLSYREKCQPIDAATDLQYLHRLSGDEPLLARLLDTHQSECDLRLKLYVYDQPASLSGVLPTLEHFGLKVVTQRPYEVRRGDAIVWIQEFDLMQTGTCALTTERMRTLFEDAFLRTVRGELEDDGFNSLVLGAGLTGRQAALLRTICKYLLQTAWPYSQNYIEDILTAHASLAEQLVKMFESQFDPHIPEDQRDSQVERLNGQFQGALDAISSLDADRVLRAYLSVVNAVLRTNYFQRNEQGKPKPYISIKLNPQSIDELPRPRPMFETFVYSPEMEGVHLRGGKVARGGLRWSDRRQDFRTEVLGLTKAQMVKNAVIVPVGAKGGFVVKRSLDGLDREAFMQAGIDCYKTFIRGLLDITDNYLDGEVVPPVDVVRLDEDDTYLVVAADKGTATFSDIANGVAQDYGFWLGDAFASGGSAGYDHKKMGITARSAWESVKRNFRELGHDTQSQAFSCVGIGDMNGDVFGNGMLLSPHTKLVAAFNHLHIFIDPDPDPAQAFAERQRLFDLPRSSWVDYNHDLISRGGGVFERTAKQIELTDEARQALGIDQKMLTPTALLHEILQAPVDLLWNGGIGTYVKARSESHMDVGDRANDGLRINGHELRCKIVGEGGNLGLTQLGRIEYALNGGRIITDFNDNAGGVNSSDREVNIKIPLNKLMNEQTLALDDRNSLLQSMTDDVSDAVLRDSYSQTQALALMQRQSVARMDEHANFMRMLEQQDLLDRAIEYLPDDDKLAERYKDGRGLTTPEQAILLSYGKVAVYDAVLASDLPDDILLQSDLLEYFPPALAQQHTEALKGHRLRREIIATVITNQCVNRMGVTYAHRTGEDRGLTPDRAVWAYLAARQIFDSERRFAAIEATDGQLPTELQYELMERVMGLIKHASQWLLRHADHSASLSDLIADYAEPVQHLEAHLQAVLPSDYKQQRESYQQRILEAGAPDALADEFANHHVIGSALDVSRLASDSGFDVQPVAQVYFSIGAQLHLPWLLSSINQLQVEGRWQALARNNLREDAYAQHRAVVARALKSEGATPQDKEQAWQQETTSARQFADQRLRELVNLEQPDFAALSIAMGELARLSL